MLDTNLITRQYYDVQVRKFNKKDDFVHSFICAQCGRQVQVKMEIRTNGIHTFVCEACDLNVDHMVLQDPLLFTSKNSKVKFDSELFIINRNEKVLKKYPSLLLNNENFRIGLNLTTQDFETIEAKLLLQEII
jgi:uncharacterized protein YlaI